MLVHVAYLVVHKKARSDIVEVGVRVVRIGHTSFLMDYQIRDVNEHERIFATGKSALVWCNYLTGRPHPIPPSLRRAFEQMEGREFPAPGYSKPSAKTPRE